MFTVYMHINKINNKKYIGITSKKPEDRWGLDGNNYRSQHFNRAIQKYGWDSFEHTILYKDLSEEEAKQLEIKLIEEYNTMDPDFGYNRTIGGDGQVKYRTDRERKQALKECAARSRIKVKQDPEKYNQRLQQMKELKRQYKEDPVMREKILEANRKWHREQRATEVGKAKDTAARKKLKSDIVEVRKKVIELYNNYPELFTEDEYHFIFDRRQTPNGSWMYVNNSKTKLITLLDIKLLIIKEK